MTGTRLYSEGRRMRANGTVEAEMDFLIAEY